jgi:exodeoxyribonuclease VII large subunit
MNFEENYLLTPTSLVHLFANSVPMDFGKELKRVKGIYVAGKDVVYAGKYYDGLRDEAGEASITLLVPAMLREQLEAGQVIELIGFLQKRVQAKGARIDLQLEITEIVGQTQASFNEDELKAFEVLQRKRDAGYLDVDGFIKNQILNDQKVSIKILVGKTGIIHSDIREQLKDAIGFYEIEFIGINLSSENEIIDALQNTDADVIAIARGGGDRMEIFDKPVIAEAALDLSAYVITALGHAQDVPLLQKVADKAFTTPTAFGQHVVDLYNHTVEEKSRSKAGMIDAVTKSLKPLYEKQIENLKNEFAGKEKNLEREKKLLEERLVHAQNVQPEVKATNWALVVLLILLAVGGGIAVGYWLLK